MTGRRYTSLAIVLHWLIAVGIFLVLYAYGMLPGVFALPAGWGDLLIGITAPVVALNLATPKYRSSFLAWQFLGIADLSADCASATTVKPVVVSLPYPEPPL